MQNVELSAVVLTQNEEKNISRCLSSLCFADEVIVVDALSEDGTVDIARAHGARVFPRSWEGFARQWQFGVDQARGEWILLCAADEEVPEALAREIREAIHNAPACQGFSIPRRSQFLGEWMRHGPWARDSQVRLFLKGAGKIADRSVHEGVLLKGNVSQIHHSLHHYTHQTLTESIQRLNRYTTLEASDRAHRRPIGALDFVFPPLGVFFKYYFIKGCWKAGIRGLLLSAITAIYKSVLYMKIFFIQRRRDTERSKPCT